MTKKEAIKFVIVRSIGNFLLLMSLYGVAMTFGPVVLQETQFMIAQARGMKFVVAQADHLENKKSADEQLKTDNRKQITEAGPSFTDVLAGATEQIIVPKDTQFSIVIPKLGATAKIFPNVDPGNPDEFKSILQQGVAHAKGTVFPGMNGNTYLFAHSADNWWDVGRYNAVFYLLKNLKKGDEVVLFFENQRYDYVVTESFITEASDTSLLAQHTDKQQLVLQTCWPPGTTLKRQFVLATPKSVLNP